MRCWRIIRWLRASSCSKSIGFWFMFRFCRVSKNSCCFLWSLWIQTNRKQEAFNQRSSWSYRKISNFFIKSRDQVFQVLTLALDTWQEALKILNGCAKKPSGKLWTTIHQFLEHGTKSYTKNQNHQRSVLAWFHKLMKSILLLQLRMFWMKQQKCWENKVMKLLSLTFHTYITLETSFLKFWITLDLSMQWGPESKANCPCLKTKLHLISSMDRFWEGNWKYFHRERILKDKNSNSMILEIHH